METKKRIRLLWTALLSLSGVLPAVATDYQASDYLPLAVGNSWTYEHEYFDLDGDISQYSAYWDQWPGLNDPFRLPELTISVLNTEVIDGKTYYVLSDMPANWPPAPPHFIAGKKLRWEGTHLMERTADGERSVFRFDGANDAGYAVETDERDNLVKTMVYPDPNGYWFSFYGSEPGLRSCTFIENYGCLTCNWGIAGSDHPVFTNRALLHRAILGGRTVELEDLLTRTNTSSSSWGQVKEEVH